ncbi:helix-turn-helix transcriptional regulator [Lentilactobacillus senioris]
MTVFDNIKEISKKRGMSLQYVAEKASMGKNSIYKWKTQTPQTDKLISVAKVLNVSVDELLGNSVSTDATIHRIDIPMEKSIQNLVNTFSKLDEEHQNRVSNYAKFQLLDQQSQQPDTLAAHQADPSHIINDDEANEITKFLDDIIDRHEKK